MGETVESEAGSRTPPPRDAAHDAPLCGTCVPCGGALPLPPPARGGGGIRPFPAAYGAPGPVPLRPTA